MADGSIDECNVDQAKTRQSSEQSSLYQFADDDETYVSIVASGNEEMQRVTDAHDGRLAPDTKLFTDWIERRDELREDYRYAEAHNRAFDEVDYRSRYREQLREAEDDIGVLTEYAETVRDGEHVVLVCYCSQGCKCHRRIAKNMIHDNVTDEE